MLDRFLVFTYLAILVFVGLRGGKSVRNATDFFAGNRRYGSFVIFASLSASFIGGGYSSGNAAAAFENGIGTALALFGFGIGMVIIGKWLVPGVVRFPGASTVGGVLGAAYGPTARFLGGVFSFLCCAGVVGAQMESIGLVFHTLLGVSTTVGTLLGCAIVLVYTTFGGLGSVIVADMIQFLLLAVGMPVLFFAAVWNGGGIASLAAQLPSELFSPLNGRTLPSFLSLFVCMMCGEALAPPYMQRLLIGKSPRSTARGTVLSGLFSLPFFLITAGIGLAARAMQVTDTAATAMPDLILAILPIGIRGLLMAAMTSIMLSAADGFLNGATVGLVCDAILPSYPHLSDRSQLRLLRGVNVITGILAVVLSLCVPNVFQILLLAYSFWSPAILVPLAVALLGIKATERTCLLSALIGFSTCLVWNTLLSQPFGIDGTPIGIMANALCFFIHKTKANAHAQCTKEN